MSPIGSATSSTTRGPSRASSTRSTPASGAASTPPRRSCSTSTSWPRGEKFLSLGAFAVSDDGNLLAYSTDVTGFRLYTLRVKDLRTGKLLPDRIEKANSPTWAADNRTLFYVAEDAAKRPFQPPPASPSAPSGEDAVVYEESDELYRLGVASVARQDVPLRRLEQLDHQRGPRPARPTGPTTPSAASCPREDGHEYDVEHRDGLFYIRTNKDAKNFKVVTAPVDDPSPVELEGADPAPARGERRRPRPVQGPRRHLRARGGPAPPARPRPQGRASRTGSRCPSPPTRSRSTATPSSTRGTFRFRYQSLVTPRSVYDYDMTRACPRRSASGPRSSAATTPRSTRPSGPTPRPPTARRSRSASSAARTSPRDGKAPLLLYGYGSYGARRWRSPSTSDRLSLLDRGVIYAQAHIRGGGDLGEPWHDAGKMMAKRNTFTDFIAAADHLIARKYTSHDRLAIRGGSAGGLLIGAVVNMRPDLARVAVLDVPFVDVINTMLDASLPLTVQEYLEWGNPNVKAEYDYMKTYCPYTNLAAKGYPSILVRTSLNDSQVMYWEPAKYVAKLRALKTDPTPCSSRSTWPAATAARRAGSTRLKEQAFLFAFLLDQLGVAR